MNDTEKDNAIRLLVNFAWWRAMLKTQRCIEDRLNIHFRPNQKQTNITFSNEWISDVWFRIAHNLDESAIAALAQTVEGYNACLSLPKCILDRPLDVQHLRMDGCEYSSALGYLRVTRESPACFSGFNGMPQVRWVSHPEIKLNDEFSNDCKAVIFFTHGAMSNKNSSDIISRCNDVYGLYNTAMALCQVIYYSDLACAKPSLQRDITFIAGLINTIQGVGNWRQTVPVRMRSMLKAIYC